MPRLLLFAPCEKLIVDELHNTTLVCLLENIVVEVKGNSGIPEGVATPKEWDVVTIWYPESGDAGRKYKQRFDYEDPDKKSLMKSEISFDLKMGAQRNKVHVNGMPVGKPGVYWAKVWLDVEGQEPSSEPLAAYPIQITHKKVE